MSAWVCARVALRSSRGRADLEIGPYTESGGGAAPDPFALLRRGCRYRAARTLCGVGQIDDEALAEGTQRRFEIVDARPIAAVE